MDRTRVEVEELIDASKEHEEALAMLIPQLSDAEPPKLEELVALAKSTETRVFFARISKTIVGTLTLVLFAIPTGQRAMIEDVVVSSSARGQGVARALLDHAIAEAKRSGAPAVELTSRPSRVEANHLYQSYGFVKRETNVYRYALQA